MPRRRHSTWGQFTAPPDEGETGEEFIDLTTPGTGEREEEDLIFGTTPGAVKVRAANWDIEAKPFALYTIASGDTFTGLAITYLGDGNRWPEIWNTGGNRKKFPKPDVINNTGPLDMPEEARERMALFLKKPGSKTNPGEIKKSELQQAKDQPKRIVAGVVAVVAAAGLGYLVYRSAS